MLVKLCLFCREAVSEAVREVVDSAVSLSYAECGSSLQSVLLLTWVVWRSVGRDAYTQYTSTHN